MTSIVHIVWRDSRDKFPVGYINFMKLRMPEYEHHFLEKNVDNTGTLHCKLDLCNDENVYYYGNMLEIFFKPSNIKLLRRCDKIIISGLIIPWKFKLLMLMSGLIRKTYLQFWGGDIYSYEYPCSLRHPKAALKKLIHYGLIKNCAGTINLIEPEVEKLCDIFPNSAKHFVAPMPADPLKKYDFTSVIAKATNHSVHRILVGHSSTESVNHMGAFHILERFKDENIEIVCPLSYGSPTYRDEVIAEGRRIFGEKFRPIVDFMSKENYLSFLASCDVGIFLTETQQGMGNISLLLHLGKKVYIREDTAMWQHFRQNMKYSVYPVSELESITLQQLAEFPQELAYNNIYIAEEYAAGNHAVEQWRKVFED